MGFDFVEGFVNEEGVLEGLPLGIVSVGVSSVLGATVCAGSEGEGGISVGIYVVVATSSGD